MKKHIMLLLSVIIFSTSIAMVEAGTAATPDVNKAIKMYKSQDYSQSYNTLTGIVAKDPSNALAYYYLAMSAAQLGKKDEAVENYTKVLNLTNHGQLKKYAEKGKTCLLEPDRCHEGTSQPRDEFDEFIKKPYGSGFSDKVRSDYEKHKIENLMREMNRKDIEPKQFRGYKDFSSAVPTNDEIVDAIRVLQRAGLDGTVLGNNMVDLSLITGNQNYSGDMLFNMFTGRNESVLSPQMLQSLLTNQMSVGF